MCALRPLLERRFPVAVPPARPRGRSVGVALAGMVGVGALVVVLIAAGAPARPEPRAARVAAVDIPVADPADVPRVEVVRDGKTTSITDADAAEIAQDLVEDLAVLRLALVTRDLDAMRATADRSWLAHLSTTIERAARERVVDVPEYDLDGLVVWIARRPGQAAPAVLATMRGRVRTETYRDGRDEPVATTAWEPIDGTFEVWWNGERFLVISDELPPGVEPPATR